MLNEMKRRKTWGNLSGYRISPREKALCRWRAMILERNNIHKEPAIWLTTRFINLQSKGVEISVGSSPRARDYQKLSEALKRGSVQRHHCRAPPSFDRTLMAKKMSRSSRYHRQRFSQSITEAL